MQCNWSGPTGVSLRIVRGNLVVPEMDTCFHAAAVLEWDRGSSGIEVCDLQSNCVWVHFGTWLSRRFFWLSARARISAIRYSEPKLQTSLQRPLLRGTPAKLAALPNWKFSPV